MVAKEKEEKIEDKKEESVATDDVKVEETKTEDVETAKKSKRKKRGGKLVPVGNAFVKATFNNTIIAITDLNGNVVATASAGTMGYSGSKKSTPYVAGLIANSVAVKAKGFGMTDVNVYVKGIGSGRESAVRGLQSSGLNVLTIKDVTPLPHNGCKRPRTRRV